MIKARMAALFCGVIFLSCSSANDEDSPPCDQTPRCDGIISKVHLLEGHLLLGLDGNEPVGYALEDSSSGCEITFQAIPTTVQTILVSCTLADGRVFSLLQDIPDLTTTKLGQQVVSESSSFGIRYPDSFSCGALSGVSLSVDVETASGGLGDPIVTPNYERQLRIELPLTNMESESTGECKPALQVAIRLFLRIRQTAADVYKGLVPCPCGV